MSAADIPPKWVLMEPFVSRRGSDQSAADAPFPFPDETRAPVRTSGTTSWNAPFTIAFKLAEPPAISRMYAYLPGFPGLSGSGRQLVSLVSTHHHLALFRVGRNRSPGKLPIQDLFVFNAIDLSLKQLPHCTLSDLGDHARFDGRQSRYTPTFSPPAQRRMSMATTGLLCQGNESVVADAKVLIRGRKNSEVYVDLFFLRSSSADYSDRQWSCARTRVLTSESTHEFRWQSYTVIPFRRWLCWIDYNRGILFGDMLEPKPTVRFVRLPPEEEEGSSSSYSPNLPENPHCWMYRGVFAIDAESCLKFVKIVRHDSKLRGPLREGCGFTITCHTLLLKDKLLNEKVWEKEYSITSDELWSANPDLPHDILIFPQVNVDRPYVIHFLTIENSMHAWKKMWVVSINMNTKKMESLYPYVNGIEACRTDDADLVKEKSLGPMPFVPCGFSEFLQFSRKRKNVD